MRTKKSLLNSFYSVVSYALLAVAGIGVRKLFLNTFSIEFLGYESLFGSIFLLLSMAEMGAGSLFNYKLYDAIAKKDKKEISILMSMYKQLYRVVGLIVLVLGAILFLFLPIIFKTDSQDLRYIQIVYIAQLITTLTTYFLAYKRSIIIANQCEYQVVKIETGFKLFNLLLRAIAIVILKSYIIYIIVSIITNILTNVVIAYKCKKDYPYIKDESVGIESYKTRGILTELKNLFISKIASTIYSSSDNVLITILVGIKTTAFYGNYALISNIVCNVFYKIIFPITASIGNMVNSESKEKCKLFYEAYNLFFMFLASFIFISFTILFQPTIVVLFGEKYILPMSFVFVFSLNNYINFKQLSVSAYRSLVGNYAKDRNFSIFAAIVNVLLSLLFGIKWGISGICAATVIGHLAIWAGRLKIVSQEYDYFTFKRAVLKEIIEFLIVLVELVITYLICKDISYTWIGIFLRSILCFLFPTIINLLLHFKTNSFKQLLRYFKNARKVMRKKS